MKNITFILIIILFFNSCKFDNVVIKNPYPTGKDTQIVKIDTWNYRTIQGLHAGLFKPTCANSGCHDGNFEPDFRTVESSYYGLINHSVIKKDILGGYANRVDVGNSANSMLLHRMKIDLNGNSGIMPLALENNSNYPLLKDSWLVRIADWIDAGAKDWVGRKPSFVDFPPQVLGVQALINGNPLSRGGQYEVCEAIAGQSFELWFSLADDITPIQQLQNATINWSTDPAKFDSTNEQSLIKGNLKTMKGIFGNNCDYLWYYPFDGNKQIEKDVIWFRITVSDAKNKNYTIPNINSMFFLKKYFAVRYN